MYAVGRLSSYITRGVSTVSGPFHPFGGAIDIIVVQQQDGSLKSSPWYVRFGKFQGVLKARERVVDINVNGVEADFHMYLNPKGEAYFLRKEVDSEELDGQADTKIKSTSVDHNFGKCDSLINPNNSQAFSRNLGFVLDRKTMNDDGILSNENNNSNVGRKSAEIAADLLEMKWSTSLSTTNNKIHHEDHDKYDGEITSGKLEASLVLHEEHFVHKPEDNERNSEVSKEVDKVTIANVDGDGNIEIYEKLGGSMENSISQEESLKVGSNGSNVQETNQEPLESCSVVEFKLPMKSDGQLQDGCCLTKETPERFVEEQFTVSDLDDINLRVDPWSKSASPNHGSDSSPLAFRRFPSDGDIAKSCKLLEEQVGARAKSLPNLWSHSDGFYPNKLDNSSYYCLDTGKRFSKWDLLRKDALRILKEGDKQMFGSQSADHKDGSNAGGDVTGKSWSLWPFTKSRSKRSSQKEPSNKKDSDFDSGSEVNGEKDHLSKLNKMHKGLTPTPKQLESLNLTEGKNTVTFTFSTAVLGNQQVDARIFLWKWDTHIVISDVDGTITKSDVLGQFMPLVGKDWTHFGVTHLFSAIKENGYQILFLSARSVSQADITRQFLINLKQEGKALPEGPVVISPDGLFPSLFREVIRRAPHEFKIACLEEIKACFPDDWNPFYAGFGNRDTDEFSYLKVGISKEKIFIINPKGEVVVNHCNDTKTYSSLHSIVNGIFPPVNVPEEVETDI